MNVTSVSTLGKYLATGMPVVQRTITVDGDACAKPQNVVVPVGTAYQDILDYVGVKGELGKVVAGGAMMGPAVENLSYPTTKTTSGLILLSKAAAQPAQRLHRPADRHCRADGGGLGVGSRQRRAQHYRDVYKRQVCPVKRQFWKIRRFSRIANKK